VNNINNFKLIFSAHGLPEKNIKNGDPYQWQVEQTVDKIVKKMIEEKKISLDRAKELLAQI